MMAKGGHDPSISNRISSGKPRTSKLFRKKGNAPARTSNKGNGKRLR
tara:strand:+ start:104 stop:244 length:141 start_codon:yes stop_codon:yes gene_type:complete